jgi:hypothetical protein
MALRVAIIGLVLAFAGGTWAGDISTAKPVRLAIQPPSPGQTDEVFTKDPAARATQCFALYIQDWLGATPGVVVMDGGQYRAWFDEAMDSSLSVHPAYSLALSNAYAPLDAAVRCS